MTFLSCNRLLSENVANDEKAGNKAQPLFFDMGHPKNPVWPGAVGVNTKTVYTAQKGYGWVKNDMSGKEQGGNGDFVDRIIEKVRGHLTPDDLTGDYVLWRGGNVPLHFRVDVPNGEYIVHLWMNGILRATTFVNLGDYSIFANGQKVAESKWNKDDFKKMLFREYSNKYEWTPGDDIWDKYFRGKFVSEYEFPVKVENNRLDIDISMPQNGDNEKNKLLSRQVCTVNGMLIYPAAKAEELKATLESINKERKQQFEKQALLNIAPQNGTMPAISKEYQESGYVPFVRNFCKDLYHNSLPVEDEIGKPVTISAAIGERAISRFAIRPLCNLKNITLEISDLVSDNGMKLPPACVSWHWLRYIEQPVDKYKFRTLDYRPIADLIMPAGSSDAVKDYNRQFLVEVTPSKAVAAGVYNGTITIKPANAPAVKLALKVVVYPFKLETYANDDERIQIYDPKSFLCHYGNLWLTSDDKEFWEYVDKDLSLMKKYRMAPTVMFDWFASMNDLDRFMDIYMKYGFHGYPLFGGYELLRIFDGKKPENTGISPFIEVLKQVTSRQKEKHWPPFLFYCTAEIHTGMPAYIKAKGFLKQMKNAVPDAKLLVLINKNDEMDMLVNSDADVIGPNAVSMTEDGIEKVRQAKKKLWFYGWGRERFRCGLIDWRIRNRGGVSEWYSFVAQAPFNPFDGKYPDCWNDAPPYLGPSGPIPTMNLEIFTAGRIDFLYLATLEQWLKRAGKIKSPQSIQACAKAQKIIDELNETIVPDYYYYYKRRKLAMNAMSPLDIPRKKIFGFADEDYDKLRQRIAESICELKDACK